MPEGAGSEADREAAVGCDRTGRLVTLSHTPVLTVFLLTCQEPVMQCPKGHSYFCDLNE